MKPGGLTRRRLVQLLVSAGPVAAMPQGVVRQQRARKPYVVLISGETANQSERSLTDLAQDLESRHEVRCNVLVASGKRDVPGLDALEDAHLVILYVNGLTLPNDQMGMLRTYVAAAKPLLALRTSIHGFENWPEFGLEVLGGTWGADSEKAAGFEVTAAQGAAALPILSEVATPFRSESTLYQVLPLGSSTKAVLVGKSPGGEGPVAWTRTRKKERVFYTSLGRAEDFKLAPFRRLLTNAVQWTLDR
jgi:hypothetical protein